MSGGKQLCLAPQEDRRMAGGRRGLVAPQNTFLENIVRRSNGRFGSDGPVWSRRSGPVQLGLFMAGLLCEIVSWFCSVVSSSHCSTVIGSVVSENLHVSSSLLSQEANVSKLVTLCTQSEPVLFCPGHTQITGFIT